MVLFLDDGWGTAPNYHECQKISEEVRHDVIKAGLSAEYREVSMETNSGNKIGWDLPGIQR